MAIDNESRSDTGKRQEWQCPAQATPVERRLGWINECTEAGIGWLKSQRGHTDWRQALDIISGTATPQALKYRSTLSSNHLKRNIREVVGTLAKLRPLWGYSSDNPAFAPNAQLFNLFVRAWYLETFADVKIKEALQYAAATCTGWIRPVYSRDFAGQGRGSVKLLSYGAPCILPTQLPPSGDFQQAYAMTILDEMPVYMAHGIFPDYQAYLRPTSSLYWYSNEIRRSTQGNIWQRMFGYGKSAMGSTPGIGDLMIPIRYTYVIDLKSILEKNWVLFESDLQRVRDTTPSKKEFLDQILRLNEVRNRYAHPIRAPLAGSERYTQDVDTASRIRNLVAMFCSPDA